jgi:hypothetical protein
MLSGLQIWSKIELDLSFIRDRFNLTTKLARKPFEQLELYLTAVPETASQGAVQLVLHSASVVFHWLVLWALLNLVATFLVFVYLRFCCCKKRAPAQLVIEDCYCKSCDVHRIR